MPSRYSHSPTAVCPCTGVGIPECSCRRCLEEQMRSFSPLVRRDTPDGVTRLPGADDGGEASEPGQGRAAA